MLTRSLYLAAGWFVISFLGLLLAGLHLRVRSRFISLAWLAIVILIGDGWSLLTFGVPEEILLLSVIGFLIGLAVTIWLPDWNALGQVLWSMTLLVTVLFSVYSFSVTAFTPLNPLSFLFALAFFFVETFALLLALTHTFESLAATTRLSWRRRVKQLQPIPGYTPKVSLHVPAYNEPPEVVQRTLESLAKLDYPNYEVLVIDNNTPDERVWRSLEAIVQQMGPRFHYLHLDNWPGYKSGALNFALTQTAPDAEIIGTIDADYQVEPNFLVELIPAFNDSQLAFVQTPQDYRDYKGHPYTEATYYSYRYFFEVSIPTRNEHNAIIFAGTMGLIRKSVLQEIGGWDEWCITEDAEASLRILKRGYQSLYIDKTYGYGLMPFTFDGLKKQRFRWCFGGIQILRKHWEALMPWARWIEPNNRLTPAQRYFYLAGGLQWYSDVLNLLFAFFLILGAAFSLFEIGSAIRPLTLPMLVMPAVFLILNIWRFLWVLRHKLHLSWKKAVITMYSFFSLGWVVTLASIQGLFQAQGVFLRTPKARSQSKTWRALQVTRWEAGIGLACVLAGIAAFWHTPETRTLLMATLLFWQGGLYLAAPVYSLLSMGAQDIGRSEVPARNAVNENWAARWALGLVVVAVAAGAIALLIPRPEVPSYYSRYQPQDVPPGRLFGFERVPLEDRRFTPTPTPTPWPTTEAGGGLPGITIVPTGEPTLTPMPDGTTTATPTPGNESPTAIPDTPLPSETPTSTMDLTLTPFMSATPDAPTPMPTATPLPTTLLPTATPGITPTQSPGPTLTPFITLTPSDPGALEPTTVVPVTPTPPA